MLKIFMYEGYQMAYNRDGITFDTFYPHYGETGKVISKLVEIALCWGLGRLYVAVINVAYQARVFVLTLQMYSPLNV